MNLYYICCVTIFKEKGIMGNKYCPLMKMRMRIKAQVKATLRLYSRDTLLYTVLFQLLF